MICTRDVSGDSKTFLDVSNNQKLADFKNLLDVKLRVVGKKVLRLQDL